MKLNSILILLTVVSILSCVRSSVDTSLGECEITVAYNSNPDNNVLGVKSILDTKCASSGCHDGTFSPNMLTFSEQLESAAANNRIRERVFDIGDMPPESLPQLNDDEIQLLECWVTGGHLENG